MDSLTPPDGLPLADSRRDLRAHYEALAQDTLRLLWRRRRFLAKSIGVALVIALLLLVHMGPRYTGSALIKLDFAEGQPIANGTRLASVTVEAVGVLKSAAEIIQSRAIAEAVVIGLGLDKDPRFNRAGISASCLSLLRRLLGLLPTASTARGIAADNLMKRVQVLAGERSYVITINTTAGDPKTAARLANAMAAEYWRTQTRQRLAGESAIAKGNFAQVALVYGPRVPSYREAQAKVRQLESELRRIDGAPERSLVEMASGHWLIPAQALNRPSGPNVPITLFLAVVLGFLAGAALVRYEVALRLPPRWASMWQLEVLPKLLALPAAKPVLSRISWLRARAPHWKEPPLPSAESREEASVDS